MKAGEKVIHRLWLGRIGLQVAHNNKEKNKKQY